MDSAQAVMASRCTAAYSQGWRSRSSNCENNVTTITTNRLEVSVTARVMASQGAPCESISIITICPGKARTVKLLVASNHGSIWLAYPKAPNPTMPENNTAAGAPTAVRIPSRNALRREASSAGLKGMVSSVACHHIGQIMPYAT